MLLSFSTLRALAALAVLLAPAAAQNLGIRIDLDTPAPGLDLVSLDVSGTPGALALFAGAPSFGDYPFDAGKS